jgi:hypothetical protein
MKKVKGGDKMDSKTLWTVVIVAIVASLITAFVTVKLTGGVIKVQPSTTGQPVYNTTEVDSKFLPVKERPGLMRTGYSRIDRNISVASIGVGETEITGDVPFQISAKYYGKIHQSIFRVANGGHTMMDITGLNEWPTIRLYDPAQWSTPARIDINTGSNSFFNNRGNFGIGNTYPQTKLDVNGTIRSQDLVGNSTAYVCATKDGRLYRSLKPCV